MKNLRLAIAALLLTGCPDFDVPDLNRPGVESLNNPTPASVEALATGLLIGARTGITGDVGTVAEWGVLGRESLIITPSDPRFVTELLQTANLDPGTPNFGGNFWVKPYANIRNANLLLDALPKVPTAGLSDAQKEAMRGFAKTIMAVDFLQIIDAHDTNGAPVDVDPLPGQPLAPIVTKDQVLTRIGLLLDQAMTHLGAAVAGGVTFPFPLGNGFAGFDTPTTFMTFNRALQARVEVYRANGGSDATAMGHYTAALAALGASFIDTTKPLTLGVYHFYGTGPGDTQNVLNAPEVLVHPSVLTDAEAGDTRIFGDTSKVVALAKPVTDGSGHSSSYGFTLYPLGSTPIPIIRNEELILLRAEANIGLGNWTGGGSPARTDINFIRGNYGLGAHGAFTTQADALAELLRQKRYSLLFEGGHRWIDLRRYGMLNTLPLDTPKDTIHSSFPIPTTETQTRP